ncbi:hypothetical protein DV736_g4387, partial [Chaetothyriales sp. CBS 134916]
MVISISVPSRSGYPSTKENGPLDHKLAIFPLRSPDLSDTATNISESGASSDQDDFHLEPYGLTTERSQHASSTPGHSNKHSNKHSNRHSNKKPRPNLNLVTEFPASQAEALAPGVKVEEVGAKRTAAKKRPKSVVSSKAEHINESGFVHRSKEVPRTKNLGARTANKAIRSDTDKRGNNPSPAKQIVIGISVPKSEADAHDPKVGHESAISLITPGTPHIVVTPADEDAPWHQQKQSTQPLDADVAHLRATALPDANTMSLQTNNQTTETVLVRHDSFDSINYDSPENLPYSTDDRAPRQSSESQQRILPDGRDDERPESQGWWNLALSPMMSRGGTIKSIRKKTAPVDAQVPSLPTRLSGRLSKWNLLESEHSPETPRHAGLANARASTWSRWTSWEKTKDRGQTTDVTREIPADGPEIKPEHVNLGMRANTAAISDSGLAAEYFRACAIEQLSGEPYFDCQNHSCSGKIPKLQSIFDQKVDKQVGNNSTIDAAVAPIPMPDREVYQQADSNPTQGAAVIPVLAPMVMPEPEHQHQRSLSDSTNVPSEPAELSPKLHEASLVSVGNAKAVDLLLLRTGTPEKQADAPTLRALEGSGEIPSEARPRSVPPIPSSQNTRYPNIAAIVPPPPAATHLGGPDVVSPGPISPDTQRIIAPEGAVPMAEMPQQPQQLHFYNHFNYPQRNYQPAAASPQLFVHHESTKDSPGFRQKGYIEDDKQEKQKTKQDESQGIFSRLKQCVAARKLKDSGEAKAMKTKLVWAVFVLLMLMIIGILVLTTQLTRHGDGTPVQQQWLNLTGYPPIPTGISTIIRPDITKTQSECVVQNMWSCALPKENQNEVKPNNPDQPNFRFEIKFQNGSVPSNMTVPLSKRLDNPFSENLFTPNPAPPSRADQLFMGNTTDNISEPFNGEPTPFFITFIPAFPIDPNDPSVAGNVSASVSRLARRQQSSNLTDVIPPPDVQSDGSAASANLLPTDPYPFSQPIRFYNRGLQDEHYGFYIYYDKAIFLSTNVASPNSSNATGQPTLQDTNGGSLRSQARARCTFSQTRFLVQIFTNPNFSGHLLGSINTTANSAMDYTPPGSFPYPTTITIDRHGGNVNKKAVYCYGVDDLQVIQDNVKAVVAEFRAVGGPGLVNPAPSLFQEAGGNNTDFNQEAGGIDGGVGGCECQWQNWG